MNEVVSEVEGLTPAWISEVLRRSGALTQGSVAGVSLKSRRELFVSVVAFLEITTHPMRMRGAPPPVLENSKAESEEAREEPPAEIVFYRSAAREMPDPPLPRCFDAAFSARE